jgi:hypothetical protein
MAVYFDRKDDYGYIRWALEVKKRDHFTCTVCGNRGVPLNSHHLNSWSDHPSERYDVQNGTTLCCACHDMFHDIYKKGKNTTDQFKEFESIMSAIIKQAKNEAVIDYTTRRMIYEAEKDRVIQQILEDLDKQSNTKDGYNGTE